MKRNFSYITIGLILDELWQEASTVLHEDQLWYVNKKGKRVKRLPVDRIKFYRVEKRLELPLPQRTKTEKPDHQWRIYTREQAEALKATLRQRFSYKFRREQ